MDAVAAAEVQKAQASTACPNPIIALNELLGSDVAGPLPASAQRYRDAVLALMRGLAADGATPFLLVPRRFTVTGTEDWWRQVGQVGWLVPEAYTPATSLWSIGNPFLISRQMRVGFREWVGRLTGLGIPASRIGLMLGFQSGDSQGGRAGLQPAAAWLEIVKLQSQAGIAVARELGLSTVWSWGWGTFATPGSADPDKQAAACTYLWARDTTLCDAPALAVPGFDPDLTAGSAQLAATTQCQYAGGSFATAELTALTTAGISRAGALTALLERSLVRARATIGPTAMLRAERSVIAGAVRRSAKHLSPVPAERGSHAGRRARRHPGPAARGQGRTQPACRSDLHRRRQGLHHGARRNAHARRRDRAAGDVARRPEGGRRTARARAAGGARGLARHDGAGARRDGPVRVRILGSRIRLTAQPARPARLAVRALILSEARRQALRDWLAGAEQAAVDTALCQADDVPVTGRSRLLARWPQFRLQF